MRFDLKHRRVLNAAAKRADRERAFISPDRNASLVVIVIILVLLAQSGVGLTA